MTVINKILLFLIVFIGMTAQAEKVKCTNPNATTFEGMIICLDEDYKFFDEELNKIYKEKIQTLNPSKQKNLRKLERQWIQRRDFKCNSLVDEINYGKESHFSAIECMTDMTKERIEFLKKYQ